MELDNWAIFVIRGIIAIVILSSVFGFGTKLWRKIRGKSKERGE